MFTLEKVHVDNIVDIIDYIVYHLYSKRVPNLRWFNLVFDLIVVLK